MPSILTPNWALRSAQSKTSTGTNSNRAFPSWIFLSVVAVRNAEPPSDDRTRTWGSDGAGEASET